MLWWQRATTRHLRRKHLRHEEVWVEEALRTCTLSELALGPSSPRKMSWCASPKLLVASSIQLAAGPAIPYQMALTSIWPWSTLSLGRPCAPGPQECGFLWVLAPPSCSIQTLPCISSSLVLGRPFPQQLLPPAAAGAAPLCGISIQS